MNKAPKKIWLDSDGTAWKHYSEEDTPYIRADLVDKLAELVELVEVLKMGTYEPYCECEKCKEVRTAIAKLEESHD